MPETNGPVHVIGLAIRDSAYGKGLFATRDIKKGEMILELDGEIMTPEAFDKRYSIPDGPQTNGPYGIGLSSKEIRGVAKLETTLRRMKKREKSKSAGGVLDALCRRNAPSYANDPDADDLKASKKAANVTVRVYSDAEAKENGAKNRWTGLWLVSRKSIEKDTELLYHYGKDYWGAAAKQFTPATLKYVQPS